MQSIEPTVVRTGAIGATLATNKLIRNTYTLLSMTLFFSAIMAGVSMLLALPTITYLLSFGGAFVLMFFVMPRTANSSMGLVTVFAMTGLLGFGIGPILLMYLSMSNGSQIVLTATGGTGAIFLGLSGYALVSRSNFNFLGGFLVTGMIVVLVAMIANIFLEITALQLAISSVVIFLMSGFILYDTSRMINGGQTNYLLATVGLYMSIFNIFIHLLSILGIMGGDD